MDSTRHFMIAITVVSLHGIEFILTVTLNRICLPWYRIDYTRCHFMIALNRICLPRNRIGYTRCHFMIALTRLCLPWNKIDYTRSLFNIMR